MKTCEYCHACISDSDIVCPICGKELYPTVPIEKAENAYDYATENDYYDPEDIRKNRVISALGYWGLLFVIPLVRGQNSPYAEFHGKQSVRLFIFSLLASFISPIGKAALIAYKTSQSSVLLFLIAILAFLSIATSCFCFYCFVTGVHNALHGKTKPLPLIGKSKTRL
jgi:uncharacterized Tic20 family protein